MNSGLEAALDVVVGTELITAQELIPPAVSAAIFRQKERDNRQRSG